MTTPPQPTSSARRWRIAALVLIAAVAAPLALGSRAFGPIGETRGIYGIAAAKDAAVARIRGPKVVLVSGSTFVFGVDTPALAAATGRPVANAGLHAGVGIDLIAERAARHVGAGDVVVLSPEWSHLCAPADANADPADPVRQSFLQQYDSAVEARGQRFPLGLYRATRARAIAWTDSTRLRWIAGVNGAMRRGGQRGVDRGLYLDPTAYDADGNLMMGRRPALRQPETIYFNDPDALARIWRPPESRAAVALDVLAEACRREGATLYAMPPIRIRPPGSEPGRLARFEADWLAFAADRAGARPLIPAGGVELPAELGFDTEYHLNDRGAAEMTTRLADTLRAVIETDRATTSPAR